MGKDTFVAPRAPTAAERKTGPDVLGAIFADKGRPTQVAVELIRTDGGTQMRAGLDDSTVFDYTQTMVAAQGWGEFPAVIAYHDGAAYWLADGFHRVAAFKDAFPDASKTIPVEVRAGTRRDAILHAAGANAVHGLRRTNADKRRAVETMLRDEEWAQWSDNEIARACAVSQPFVGSVRKSLEAPTYNGYKSTPRTGADGRVYNTTNIGNNRPATPTPPPAKVVYTAPAEPAPAVFNTAPAGETRQQQIEREWRESNASRVAYLDENARRNEEHFRQMREQLAAARAQQEPEAAVISLDDLEVVASVTVPAAAPVAPVVDPSEEIEHPLDCYEDNETPALKPGFEETDQEVFDRLAMPRRMRDLWELKDWFKRTKNDRLPEYHKLTGREVSAALVVGLDYMIQRLEEAMDAFQAEVEASHVNH